MQINGVRRTRCYNRGMDEQIQTIKNWLGVGSINLFGRPFSGKDTQGERIVDALDAVLIGGGDILRSHDDPAKIEQIMASGGLVPTDFYFELVLPYLSRAEFKDKPLILDAVGRSSGEEEVILKATKDSGHPLMAVVVLDISEEEVWKRFEAAKAVGDRDERADDRREVLANRLRKYQEKTLPVLDFYRQQGLLVTIDGTGSRDDVTAAIFETLASLASQK